MNHPPKILILGQGLAGTLLANALLQKGAQVAIFDPFFLEEWGGGAAQPLSLPASVVAAGIINPVTGKRYVKSWRFDESYPFARETYRALEATLGIDIWQELPILRLLSSTEADNDWAARCSKPDYAAYLESATSAGAWAPLLKPGFRFGNILQAARVDLLPLLRAFRRYAQAQGFFLQASACTDLESLLPNYDYILFCEGAGAAKNPLFAQLPWELAKGEALLIRFTDPTAAGVQQMLKMKIMVAPIGHDLFWCGSPYAWHFENEMPSSEGRAFIEENLQQMLEASYEVKGHLAAVRPTVKDRRPFVGLLPQAPKIGIFNGLGTKGALLGPFWANHFAEHLLEGRALDVAVDVRRFLPG